jgi:hypothetical protein
MPAIYRFDPLRCKLTHKTLNPIAEGKDATETYTFKDDDGHVLDYCIYTKSCDFAWLKVDGEKPDHYTVTFLKEEANDPKFCKDLHCLIRYEGKPESLVPIDDLRDPDKTVQFVPHLDDRGRLDTFDLVNKSDQDLDVCFWCLGEPLTASVPAGTSVNVSNGDMVWTAQFVYNGSGPDIEASADRENER